MIFTRINQLFSQFYKYFLETVLDSQKEKQKLNEKIPSYEKFLQCNLSRLLVLPIFLNSSRFQDFFQEHEPSFSNFENIYSFITLFFDKMNNEYFFNTQKFCDLIQNFFENYLKDLPIMFKTTEWEDSYPKLKFTGEMLQRYIHYLKSWNYNDEPLQNIKINIKNHPLKFLIDLSNQGERDNIFLHLIYFSLDLNEIITRIQDSEQKITHKGVFYSNFGEIRFILLTSIISALKSHYNLNTPKTIEIIHQLEFLYDATLSDILKRADWIKNNETSILTYYNFILNRKILDPANGTGLFLISWFLFLLKFCYFLNLYKNERDLSEFTQNNTLIYGVDIDFFAIMMSDLSLWAIKQEFLTKPESQNHHFNPTIRLINDDFLLYQKENFPKFDLIVGNPPYIRNRDLKHPISKDPKKAKLYRVQIRKTLKTELTQRYYFADRIDYAIYFFLHSIELLKDRGILTFICSNSWMNVKYGYEFQKFLLNETLPLLLCESQYQSFKNAQVKTTITAFQRHIKLKLNQTEHFIPFIQIKQPYQNITFVHFYKYLLMKSKKKNHIFFNNMEDYRILQISQKYVYSFNLNPINNDNSNNHNDTSNNNQDYEGYNWNNFFFYAPFWFLTLWQNIGKKITKLGDIATISRGITTNCNDYFILEQVDKNLYRNGYGDIVKLPTWTLTPLLTTPREINTPIVDAKNLKSFLFTCPFNKEELTQYNNKDERQQVQNYIRLGETKPISIQRGSQRGTRINGVIHLASFQKKYQSHPNSWYQIYSKVKSESDKILFIQKIFDTNYKIGLASQKIAINNTFYCISLNKSHKKYQTIIFSLLQSALTIISLELQGRLNFGGGALDTATFDIENILVINPLALSIESLKEIKELERSIILRSNLPSSQIFQTDLQQKIDQFVFRQIDIGIPLSELYADIQEIQNIRVSKR